MKDVSDPKQVKDASKKSIHRQRGIDNALKAMMEHRATRTWLFDLLEFCNVYRSSFSTSGLIMAQNEGQRNVGLKVLSDIMRVSPQQYVSMLQEQKEPDEDERSPEHTEPDRTGSE